MTVTCRGQSPERWERSLVSRRKENGALDKSVVFSVTDPVLTDLHGLRAAVGRTESRRVSAHPQRKHPFVQEHGWEPMTHTRICAGPSSSVTRLSLWRSQPGRGGRRAHPRPQDRGGYRATHGGTVTLASSPAATGGAPPRCLVDTDTQRYRQLFRVYVHSHARSVVSPPACVWGEQTHRPRDSKHIPPCSVSRILNTKQMVGGTGNLRKWSLS